MGLFGRQPLRMTSLPRMGVGGVSDPELSTGDADDDEVLRQLARRSPLDAPRHWVHFLLCPDEAEARAVAAEVAAAGWAVRADPDGEGAGWCVAAVQFGVVASADAVRRARVFFGGWPRGSLVFAMTGGMRASSWPGPEAPQAAGGSSAGSWLVAFGGCPRAGAGWFGALGAGVR